MKVLLWVAFTVLAALWTGLIALTDQVGHWLVTAMGSGKVADLATLTAQIPLPAWASIWVDTAWLQELQMVAVSFAQWLMAVLPSADGLMSWISPLLWVGWALGLLMMVLATVVGHWFMGRVK